jgi:hypothetical protein
MLLIIVTANRVLRMGCEEIQRHLTPEVAFVCVALKYRHQFDDDYPEFLQIENLFHQTSIRADTRSDRGLPLERTRYVVAPRSIVVLLPASNRLQKVLILASVSEYCITNARFNLPGGGQKRFATRSVSSTDITAVGKRFSVCGCDTLKSFVSFRDAPRRRWAPR